MPFMSLEHYHSDLAAREKAWKCSYPLAANEEDFACLYKLKRVKNEAECASAARQDSF